VACVEEAAYRMKYIDADQVVRLDEPLLSSGYGRYLLNILEYAIYGSI
jgi:glucose-1-phosphate thymidylyltransferase